MKRRWRIGRLILAGLLLGLSVMFFLLWPLQPRWSIQGEMALGFDLSRGHLISIKIDQHESNILQLYGHNLVTGDRTFDLPIILDEQYKHISQLAKVVLSADGSKLAYCDDVIVVFDLHENGRLLLKCRPVLGTNGLCFSENSSLLAFLSSDEVEIWDIAAGKRKAQIAIPQEMISPGGSGPGTLKSENMRFSNDERYLAICGNRSDVIVYDWQADKEIGVCPDSRSPLCFVKNTTLYVSAVTDEKRGIRRFQIEDEQLKPVPTFTGVHALATSFQAFSNNQIHIGRLYFPSVRFPAWMRDNLVTPLQRMFGLNGVCINMRVYDMSTNELRNEFDLRTKSINIIYFSMLEAPMFKVSPDGRLVAILDGDEVTLWDIPPRRSLWCWNICIGISLLAFMLAWPKRVAIKS